MMLIFTIVLLISLVLHVQLLKRAKAGALDTGDLGFFKRNILNAYRNYSAKMGNAYYAVFYTFFSVYAIYALYDGAWITALVCAAYLCVNYQFFKIVRLGQTATPVTG